MNCLVTGGCGFIGSHLCKRLIDQKQDVICVDNLLTGNKKNIEQLLANPSFKFIQHDCINPLDIDEKVDVIFHLASPASPPKYQKYQKETFLVNTIGTNNLLEIAVKNRAKFIFASTSESYGDPLEHPQKETYWGHVNPVGLRSCYDESKRGGEALTMIYFRKYGVDVRIVRIFNTYGPNMDLNDGRVVTNFINQMLHNQPLTVNGKGEQTRSFCYVSDLIEGLVAISNCDKCRGEVVNLGNPDERTILELAQVFKTVTGYPGEIIFQGLPSDDPMRRQPDITKIKKMTGWEPKIKLEEGLIKTVEYFKQ